MKKSLKLILCIIGILLVVGIIIFFVVRCTFNKEKPTKEGKILYTFTDPLNNKVNLVYNEILHDKYIGADLSKYEDMEDDLRKKIKGYVYKDSDVKALNLSEDYNEAYSKLLRKIRGINGSGYSVKGLEKALEKDKLNVSNEVIEYVVNNANIDYNDQALMVAYKYLSAGHSKEGIERKLIQGEFTEEEIEFAMNEIKDVDFYEQALHEACFYRFYKKYDKAATARYLRIESFTEEEIEYAVNTAFEKIK